MAIINERNEKRENSEAAGESGEKLSRNNRRKMKSISNENEVIEKSGSGSSAWRESLAKRNESGITAKMKSERKRSKYERENRKKMAK
jgi:hypothetical protein